MVLDNLILLGNEYILPCVLDMSDTLIFYHLFALEVSGVKRRIAFRKGKGKKSLETYVSSAARLFVSFWLLLSSLIRLINNLKHIQKLRIFR